MKPKNVVHEIKKADENNALRNLKIGAYSFSVGYEMLKKIWPDIDNNALSSDLDHLTKAHGMQNHKEQLKEGISELSKIMQCDSEDIVVFSRNKIIAEFINENSEKPTIRKLTVKGGDLTIFHVPKLNMGYVQHINVVSQNPRVVGYFRYYYIRYK